MKNTQIHSTRETNDYIMQYPEDKPEFEFWYDHIHLALAA